MSRTIIDQLREEQAALEAALEAVPLYRKLRAVRASIMALGEFYDVQDHDVVGGSRQSAALYDAGTGRLEISGRRGSLSSEARRVAKEEMLVTGRRVLSSRVVELLMLQGAPLPENKPQAAVASALSANPEFDNKTDAHGAGYGLRIWSEGSPLSTAQKDGRPTELFPDKESPPPSVQESDGEH